MIENAIAIGFICWIFFFHTMADFVFQTRWMAENKSSSLKALLIHILEYTGVMFVGLIILIGFRNAFLYAILNGLLHFITDFFTSKINSYAYKNNKMKLFWSMIGFDQFIHICSLLFTLLILT